MNRCFLFAMLMVVPAGIVNGQSVEPAEESEVVEPADDAIEHESPTVRAKLGLARIPAEPVPISPVVKQALEPVAPGLTAGQDWLAGLAVGVTGLPEPSLLPEGMVLRERVGSIWPGRENLWVFLPSEADRRPGEGAMLIAPNGARDRMTAMLEGQPDGQTVVVSGQVLLYHDHNYLLISSYRRAVASDQPSTDVDLPNPPEPVEPVSDQPTPAVDNTPPPEVDALIRDLEGASRSGVRRDDSIRERLLAAERDRANQGGAPASSGGSTFAPPLLADGSYLAQRRTRLVRRGHGAWVLQFDGDTAKLGDGSLIVIPGRVLMLMERRAGIAPETPMTVSGRVYTSQGKGYFLPTVFRLEQRGDISPIQ